MLRNGHDTFKGRKNLKVLLVPSMRHLQAIQDAVGLHIVFQFFKKKCVADDALDQVFHAVFFIGVDSYLVMNVEPGNMPPGHKHLDEGIVYQPLFLQHLEYMSTEKLD